MTKSIKRDLDPVGAFARDDRKLEAVATYLSTGSLVKTSKLLGINRGTLSRWRQTDWWLQAEQELKTRLAEEQHALMREIIMAGNCELLDRIKNGDVQIVKGVEVRVPIKARDLAVVNGITFDKLQVSLGQPTSITATEKPCVGERAIEAMFSRPGPNRATEASMSSNDNPKSEEEE